MEMQSLSLCLEAPGSCAAQFIESERHTAANTCVMPATPATRNVRSVASADQGPLAASDARRRKMPEADALVGPDCEQWVRAVKGGAFQWVQTPPGETLQPEANGAWTSSKTALGGFCAFRCSEHVVVARSIGLRQVVLP